LHDLTLSKLIVARFVGTGDFLTRYSKGETKTAPIQDFPRLFKKKQYSFNLTLNLPTTTIVAQPFNVIKWQLKFNPVA